MTNATMQPAPNDNIRSQQYNLNLRKPFGLILNVASRCAVRFQKADSLFKAVAMSYHREMDESPTLVFS
jgi:hypothetical protein